MKIKQHLRRWSLRLVAITTLVAALILLINPMIFSSRSFNDPKTPMKSSIRNNDLVITSEKSPEITNLPLVATLPEETTNFDDSTEDPDELIQSEEILEDPYNGFTREDYILLATTIYCEADPQGCLEEAIAIGWVIRNRLEDTETWGDSSFLEVISRKDQFSVYSTNPESKFCKIYSKIETMDGILAENAREAAMVVLSGEQRIPEDIQFFCADYYYETVKRPNGNWSSHSYYDTIGGTVFFHKN